MRLWLCEEEDEEEDIYEMLQNPEEEEAEFLLCVRYLIKYRAPEDEKMIKHCICHPKPRVCYQE